MNNSMYKWSKNGMKMIINTDYKTFNKQTNCIMWGNIISNTQIGFYIRAYNETSCNGLEHDKGYLQNYDLKQFKMLPCYIENDIKKIAINNGVYLHKFFTYDKYGRANTFGWLLLDEQERKVLKDWVVGYSNLKKKENALDYVTKIIIERR